METLQRETAPTPRNPDWMSKPTLIRRIGPRGFTVAGRGRIEVGEVVRVDRFTALGLVQQGKAELVAEQ